MILLVSFIIMMGTGNRTDTDPSGLKDGPIFGIAFIFREEYQTVGFHVMVIFKKVPIPVR